MAERCRIFPNCLFKREVPLNPIIGTRGALTLALNSALDAAKSTPKQPLTLQLEVPARGDQPRLTLGQATQRQDVEKPEGGNPLVSALSGGINGERFATAPHMIRWNNQVPCVSGQGKLPRGAHVLQPRNTPSSKMKSLRVLNFLGNLV